MAVMYRLMMKKPSYGWIEMIVEKNKSLPPQIASRLNSAYQQKLVEIGRKLESEVFWWIDAKEGEAVYLYDSGSGLVWDAKPDRSKKFVKEDAQKEVEKRKKDNKLWKVPEVTQLADFAVKTNNPLRNGSYNRIFGIDYWITQQGQVDLDNFHPDLDNFHPIGLRSESGEGYLIACMLPANSVEGFIQFAQDSGWKLRPVRRTGSNENVLAPLSESALKVILTDIDYQACRLPKLESAQFTDPGKGLWELWGAAPEVLAELGARARNPADDVKDWNIAIDFGTSSTVVAYDDNGQHKLLRVGVKDFMEKPVGEHYENPTVLEFIDFQNMLRAWQAESYRPAVLWDDVRCSHEALHNLRNNETNPVVVSSILGKIKQWALRQGTDRTLRLIDQKHRYEHELAPLQLRFPVTGKALTVGADDPFDPVELYAWFLGMNINWRGRGLFLRYYMTFPVAYPREVKENILASFRRGLQRSLPPTLVDQPVFSTFKVEELASEPAAYAAAALPKLGLAPTTEGLAYAVFDFGGGTADFDFGYYRLPTPEEEDDGSELVFEHFGNEGDRFLGGENLLENMAYRTFIHNQEICRKHRIAFTRPLDAEDFPGSELFLEKTQAAATNTLMLTSRLRPLWEKGALENTSGIEKLHLLNRDGERVQCELAIPVDVLQDYLEQRIEAGIQNFFVALKNAFADRIPQEVHVLLAGNSSRSRQVLGFMGLLQPEVLSLDRTESVEGTDEEYEWLMAEVGGITAALGLEREILSEYESGNTTPKRASQRAKMQGAEPLQDADFGALFARTRAFLESLFGDRRPAITVYPPLPIDEQDLYRPTAKTGVALGLLKLCPGGSIDVINHAQRHSGDQAPFAHYVGRIRQQCFQPALKPGVPYNEWHEVGPPRERVFNLFHSQTPQASTGTLREGTPGLFKKRLDLAGDTSGKRVFIRAVGPSTIEYCTASAREELDSNSSPDNLTKLTIA